jgi:hypothetical protein
MSPDAKRASVFRRKGDEVRESHGEGSQGLSGVEGPSLHKRRMIAEDWEAATEDSTARILNSLGDVPPKLGQATREMCQRRRRQSEAGKLIRKRAVRENRVERAMTRLDWWKLRTKGGAMAK